MDIEIILEPDLHPNEIAEIAVKAEEYGIRALWSSNYHQNWDAFISLVPAAQKTKKILKFNVVIEAKFCSRKLKRLKEYSYLL